MPATAENTAEAQSGYEVVFLPNIPTGIRPMSECRHPGPEQLTINQRLEKKARGRGMEIAVDAVFCMGCGCFHQNTVFDSWEHAVAFLWDEFGWHAGIGGRIQELAEHRIPDTQLRYFALQFGLTPEETTAYLASGSALGPVEWLEANPLSESAPVN